ncbi:Sigma-24 [Legionella massiliensis]|uniref:Sigma-24 n=1 Tax=Legionella massiliensis TaxID=1034943 RepID=A0A078L2D3_9GAMM|nr:sigma-70 family RNA polymerase sigma factor [Legionella massiliensis]CDZ78259.1 Sigma-24 [Legionella massiliensis]CEE13997.1 ECF RNA polymerase sigma-E factor [Legionella massiliensis]
MNKLASATEQQLIDMALSGQPKALNQLLRLNQSKIFQQVRSRVADYSLACDLLQEINIKIFRYLPTFKGESSFSTWLYRIIQNTLKNHYRSRCSELESSFSEKLLETVDEKSSPETQLIALQLAQQVNKICTAMPKDLSHCFQLYLTSDLSYDELAKQLQCPLGTVRSRIHRAKTILQENIPK